MAALEELRASTTLRGVIPERLVTVVNVQWFGSDAIELTFKDASGRPDRVLLFRDDEERFEVVEEGRKPLLQSAGGAYVP